VSDTPQGPGWWQASDGKYYPPEQAPGYQQPAGGGAAAGGGGTDLGSVFSFAWNKFIQNIGEWIVLWLVFIGIYVAFIIFAIVFGVAFGGTGFGFSLDPLGILYNVVVGIIFGLVYTVVAKAAAMAANGERVDIGAAFRLTGNNIAAGVVFGAVWGALNLFCGIGGVVAFLLLGFLPVLSALYDRGADAVSEALNVSTGNPGEALVWMLLAWLISGLCFIGAPIALLGATYLVKRYRGEPVVT
jgi:hypothetical protein